MFLYNSFLTIIKARMLPWFILYLLYYSGVIGLNLVGGKLDGISKTKLFLLLHVMVGFYNCEFLPFLIYREEQHRLYFPPPIIYICHNHL
jgi:hypothetical protein